MPRSSTPGLVWIRDGRPSAPRAPLRRAVIVEAVIGLLDRDGVEALSMRKLATRLSVAPATLYWHVANKEELLDIAFDEVMGELPDLGDAGGDWRDQVRAMLTAVRDLMSRHPWYPALSATRPVIGPHGLRYLNGWLGVLARAGFSGADLDAASTLLTHFVVGTTLLEATWAGWLRRNPQDVAATQAYVRQAVRAYPHLEDQIENYLAVTPPEQRQEYGFAFAVERILAGLETSLTNTVTGPG